MKSALRVIYRIDVAATGPRQARGIVATELVDRLPADELAELQLLVSELVTHRIAQSDDGDSSMLLDLSAGQTVRCDVIDEAPATLPAGLGLRVMDRLARRWGVTRSGRRTLTWVEAGSSDPLAA
jgi:hypothetical protein